MTKKQMVSKIKKFRRSKTGKKTETVLWQMAVMTIQILLVAANEFDVRFLIASTPMLLMATKFINTKYLK